MTQPSAGIADFKRDGKIWIDDDNPLALPINPEPAQRQLAAEPPTPGRKTPPAGGADGTTPQQSGGGGTTPPPAPTAPKRFHGTAPLDSRQCGRDAGRIAEEVVAHLSGIVGADVKVALEIQADIPSGAPDHVVRTVTENRRTLKSAERWHRRPRN